MATAFVTVAQATTAALLNPAYRADEFEFLMNDLKADPAPTPIADTLRPKALARGKFGHPARCRRPYRSHH